MSKCNRCKAGNNERLSFGDKLTVYNVKVDIDDVGAFTYTRNTSDVILTRRCDIKTVGQLEVLDGDRVTAMNRYEIKMRFDKSLRSIKEYHIATIDTQVNENNEPILLYIQGMVAKLNSSSQIGRLFAVEVGHAE